MYLFPKKWEKYFFDMINIIGVVNNNIDNYGRFYLFAKFDAIMCLTVLLVF